MKLELLARGIQDRISEEALESNPTAQLYHLTKPLKPPCPPMLS